MKIRAGFALVAALLALILIAVLVTGALFATNQETRASDAEMLDQKAASYAELAALNAIADWNGPACDALAVGEVIIESPAADSPFESSVYVTRLDSALFLVVGEGRIASGGATRLRRRVALTVRSVRGADSQSRAMRVSEQAWAAIYQM